MRFRKSAHAVYHTEYHIVWTPRYRRKILVKGVKEYLENTLYNLNDLDEDIEVKKVNVQLDHVHLVVLVPPRISVSSAIQFMKSQTGGKLREKFDFIDKAMQQKGKGMWSRGYCVSTVGMNEKMIMEYVEHQEKEAGSRLADKSQKGLSPFPYKAPSRLC